MNDTTKDMREDYYCYIISNSWISAHEETFCGLLCVIKAGKPSLCDR